MNAIRFNTTKMKGLMEMKGSNFIFVDSHFSDY